MTNIELRDALINAAQNKNFPELMSLLNEHSPDLSQDDFKIKVPHIIEKKHVIIDKDVRAAQINGSVLSTTVDGYQLTGQVHKTKPGAYVVNPAGDWTFTITTVPILQKLAAGGSTVIHEEINLSYSKQVVITSVAHVLTAYVAYYCSCGDMQKVLDLGACPNSNNANSQNIGLSAAKNFISHQAVPDKYAGESRSLVNAIKQGKLDMAETLINHACPCCSGAGAKVTQNLIDLAQELKQDAIHQILLQAVN